MFMYHVLPAQRECMHDVCRKRRCIIMSHHAFACLSCCRRSTLRCVHCVRTSSWCVSCQLHHVWRICNSRNNRLLPHTVNILIYFNVHLCSLAATTSAVKSQDTQCTKLTSPFLLTGSGIHSCRKGRNPRQTYTIGKAAPGGR
jgi:hypothetical protein